MTRNPPDTIADAQWWRAVVITSLDGEEKTTTLLMKCASPSRAFTHCQNVAIVAHWPREYPWNAAVITGAWLYVASPREIADLWAAATDIHLHPVEGWAYEPDIPRFGADENDLD